MTPLLGVLLGLGYLGWSLVQMLVARLIRRSGPQSAA
jgi:hypothetical protein